MIETNKGHVPYQSTDVVHLSFHALAALHDAQQWAVAQGETVWVVWCVEGIHRLYADSALSALGSGDRIVAGSSPRYGVVVLVGGIPSRAEAFGVVATHPTGMGGVRLPLWCVGDVPDAPHGDAPHDNPVYVVPVVRDVDASGMVNPMVDVVDMTDAVFVMPDGSVCRVCGGRVFAKPPMVDVPRAARFIGAGNGTVYIAYGEGA